MKKLNRRTRVLILTLVMAALLAVVYLAGLLVPEEAVASDFLNAKQPPSWEHLFGTDTLAGICSGGPSRACLSASPWASPPAASVRWWRCL